MKVATALPVSRKRPAENQVLDSTFLSYVTSSREHNCRQHSVCTMHCRLLISYIAPHHVECTRCECARSREWKETRAGTHS